MPKNPVQAIIEAEQALLRLNSSLDATNIKLAKTAQLAADSNRAMSAVSTPSAISSKVGWRKKMLEQTIALIKEQERLEQRLITQIERNRIATEGTARGLAKQKYEYSVLNKEVKQTAILNSQLAGAYDKLVVKMNRVGTIIRDLMIKKTQGNNLTRKEQVLLEQSIIKHKQYAAAVMKADAAIGRHQRNVGNYTGSLRKLGLSFRTLISGFGIYGGAALFAQSIISVFNLVKKLQSLEFALKAVTSANVDATTAEQNLARTHRFLNDITDRYGTNLKITTERYTKFLAAANQSNVAMSDTEKIFRTVTKASAVLGLTTEDLNGIYLALEQMLSKGKVTTEELRRQLGERLPGAFGIMATALGKTTQELDSMLKKGEILSADALPKFARALELAYGLDAFDSIHTVVAEQQRLNNAYLQFVQSVEGGEGVLSKAFGGLIVFITDALKGMTLLNMTQDDLNQKIQDDRRAQMLAEITLEYLKAGDAAEAMAAKDLDHADALVQSQQDKIDALKKEKESIDANASSVIKYLRNANNVITLGWVSKETDAQQKLNKELFEANLLLGDYLGMQQAAEDELGLDKKNVEQKIEEIELLKDSVGWWREKIKLLQDEIELQTDREKIIEIQEKINKAEEELTKLLGEQNKKRKEGIDALVGSRAWFADRLKKLEDEQNKLATNSDAWGRYAIKVRDAKDKLKEFDREAEIVEMRLFGGVSVLKDNIKGYEAYTIALDAMTESIKKQGESIEGIVESKSLVEFNKQLKSAAEEIAELQKLLRETLGADLSSFFSDADLEGSFDMFMKVGKNGTTTFQKLREEAKKSGQEMQFLFSSYTMAASEGLHFIANTINEFSDQNIERYDNEIEANKDYYAELLDNEELSVQQRDALEAKRDAKERELEKKKRGEQRKQAQINKALAAFDVVINTAKAVAEANPVIPLMAFAAAIGAVQLGTVLSQPIPQFAEGKNVNDNYEGMAIWGEKKREVKIGKDGIQLSPKKIGNHLTHVRKDDVILPDADKFISSLTDQELFENHNRISMLASLATQSSRLNYEIMKQGMKRDNEHDRLLKEFNKKKMSFKINQSISVADDIAFMFKKQNTL